VSKRRQSSCPTIQIFIGSQIIEGQKMLSKTDIMDFTNAHLLNYELHGILQVGSSARGYSTPNSDVDLMAFYNTDSQLVSQPIHTTYQGVKVTLEQHDLNNFLLDTLDHRFNIASLRQLHKVRDSVVLQADQHLLKLITISQLAYLDELVLLLALKNIAPEWSLIRETNVAHSRHLLIKWSELLSTLDVMTSPN
jgi:predicted nucleotidyltransferase